MGAFQRGSGLRDLSRMRWVQRSRGLLTETVGILVPRQRNRLLGDGSIHDPVRTQGRQSGPERHDHVVPGRVRGLLDIGWRRERLGVGMRVHHAEDLETGILGIHVGTQMGLGIDGVDPTRCRHIDARVEPGDRGQAIIIDRSREEPAGLVGQSIDEMSDEVEVHRPGDGEHDAEIRGLSVHRRELRAGLTAVTCGNAETFRPRWH